MAFLTTEREWPWRDGDLLGWPGLVLVAALLVLLTLWTYVGQRKVGWNRLLLILGLRLAALALTALLILRPSFASEEQIITAGKLIIVIDSSSSMQILDGPASSSRWDTVRKLLEWPDIKEALERLRKERQIEIIFYQAAEDVHPYDPTSAADGKRTDIGQWLHTLIEQHKSDKNLRGLLIFSDGQDNGTRYLARDEAPRWRGLSCPIHTFAVGLETTVKGQKDIAVADLKTDKDRSDFVYVGNEINVKAIIDAPSLEGQLVTVRLCADGKQVSMKEGVPLPATRGNVIDAGKVVAGPAVGEMKITVKVDEVPGEFTTQNNELTTYVNVRKKGINILWVDARYREESTWIMRRALKKDQRFNIVHVVRPQDVPLTPQERALFTDPEKAFDVVVIGDISAALFSGQDPVILDKVRERVASKRTGLLLLGAAKSISEDWRTTGRSVADLLPVQLDDPGEINYKITAVPDAANKGHRFVQLDPLGGKDVWTEVFKPLEGMSKLGKVRPGADVLLRADTGDPLLVIGKEDTGRVAVFGAGNTFQAWYGNEDAIRAYERFWTQLMAWLAGQEKGDNQVWIKLDRRRMAAGAKERLGFTVGLIGEDGGEAKNPIFTVIPVAPNGDKLPAVTVRLKAGEYRGEFDQANVVGEYRFEVNARGTSTRGKEFAAGPVTAHFSAFSEDVENQRPAANYQTLTRVAEAGGGAFHMAGKEDLMQYLTELRDRTNSQGWVRRDVWPNWKYLPASEALPDQLNAMVASGALPCLVLFLTLVSAEWFLRRWWGLV
jgi:uncharacterized membrane protein